LESGAHDQKALGAAAALRFYYAQQLELPATAVAEMTVINGRLFMGAQLLRALAERRGYRVLRLDSSDESCTAVLLDRNGERLGDATFTIEQAQKAGLIRDRSAWKTHPARMLWARASTNVIRDFAPAVSLGIGEDSEIPEYQGETIEQDPADEVEWPGEPGEWEAAQMADETGDTEPAGEQSPFQAPAGVQTPLE
jgi:hypothetical protein